MDKQYKWQVRAYVLALCLALMSYNAKADDPLHLHGYTVPDWYDSSCCNYKDCRPVPTDSVKFGQDEFGNELAIHTDPEGKEHKYWKYVNGQLSYRWRNSQDERYHACYNRQSGSDYCIYIPIDV